MYKVAVITTDRTEVELRWGGQGRGDNVRFEGKIQKTLGLVSLVTQRLPMNNW